MEEISKENIAAQYREIQELICTQIAEVDGKGSFVNDSWERAEGGGGLSRILTDGNTLEKAGVNFSAVMGELDPAMKQSLKMDGADEFYATGVSIVMHPQNPHIPIIHMNIRYFELDDGTYWFGGGIDLTPHYINKAEAVKFHQALRKVCNQYDPKWYADMKKRADDYFFIPHRDETRGIGGIFYDHLSEDGTHSKADLINFSLDLGRLFPEIYAELIEANRNKTFSQAERDWQLLRRGRYVEFNLVYDRGTRFGLLSKGRTESILMSLPKDARWLYDFCPEPESAEAETLEWLKKGVDWVGL